MMVLTRIATTMKPVQPLMELNAIIAYHEAGHAVMAWRTGRRIRRVQASAREGGLFCQVLKPSDRQRLPVEGFQSGAAQETVIALAGIAAEQRLKIPFDPVACSVDVQNAHRWLSELGHEDDPSYEWILAHTIELLAERHTWRAVRAIARRLVQVGEISGDEVDAICEEFEVPRSSRASRTAPTLARHL
jgi:hypothetical protein